MRFDYSERFALLLNDLDGLMKLPPGKYPPENSLGIFPPLKIPTINFALKEAPPSPPSPTLVEIPSGTVILVEYIRITFDHRIS